MELMSIEQMKEFRQAFGLFDKGSHLVAVVVGYFVVVVVVV